LYFHQKAGFLKAEPLNVAGKGRESEGRKTTAREVEGVPSLRKLYIKKKEKKLFL
jgi:hypothetical protein